MNKKPQLTRQLMIDNLLGYHNNLTREQVEEWSTKNLWAYTHPLFRDANKEAYNKMYGNYDY